MSDAYDPILARTLGVAFDYMRAQSRPVTLTDLDGRPLPVKLRDGLARLFAPYL